MQRTETARAEFVPLGGERRGYYAAPSGTGPFPGVLVFQEAFGVNEYIQSEVRRLAEHGFAAIAPDLFRGETYAYTDFAKVAPRLPSLTDELLTGEIDAALAFLDAQREVKKGTSGVVGFCLGGRAAVLTALARPERIAAAASFYGGGIAPEQPRFFTPLLDRLGPIRGELLLIYGADDESILPKEHATIAERLSTLKKRYTLTVYPGAPHAFASRGRDNYRPQQAEDAWSRTLALFDRTLR
jgi:carboxymethylenebutenolidase